MLGGHLSDRLGRKDVFLADMALLAVAALILVLANSVWWVLAGQFLVGVAIGMDFPAASAYVAEVMPAAERQKMVVGTITFQAVGMVLASALGVWLLQRSGSVEAWRWLFGPGGAGDRILRAPAVDPGEPALAGRARACDRRRARGVAPGRPRPRLGRSRPDRYRPAPPRGYGALFGPTFLRLTILTAGAWFLMDIATYGVGIFTPVILQSLDPAAGVDSTLVYREIHVGRASGLVDLFLLLGFHGHLAGAAGGRDPYAGPGLCRHGPRHAGSGLGLGPDGRQTDRGRIVILGFVLFNLAMNMGPNSTTFTLPALLFPTTLRPPPRLRRRLRQGGGDARHLLSTDLARVRHDRHAPDPGGAFRCWACWSRCCSDHLKVQASPTRFSAMSLGRCAGRRAMSCPALRQKAAHLQLFALA